MTLASTSVPGVKEPPRTAVASVCVPRVNYNCLLPLRETLYQVTVSALGSRACEILYVPFTSEVSISPSPMGLSEISPTGLQSQMF